MLRLLRTRRWLSLLLLVAFLVPSCLLLSRWQFHRLADRKAANALVRDHADSAPVPVEQLLTPDRPVTDDVLWRQVRATGHYDADAQVLVRRRPMNQADGFLVAVPLVLDDGTVLVVDRGWVPAGPDALTSPAVSAPPTGEVEVVGRIQASEQAPEQPADIPHGQVTDLDARLVGTPAGGTVLPGYVDLIASVPAEAGVGSVAATPYPVGLPDLDEGPHLSYALQWIAFAILAIVGFVVLLRREADPAVLAAEAARRAAAGSGAPPAVPAEAVSRDAGTP